MSLVAYSDSETSSSDSSTKRNIVSNSHTAKGLKRKRKTGSDDAEQQSNLPPLPDSFHDLYSSTARASNQDDPSLHAGRQRQEPQPTRLTHRQPFTDRLQSAVKESGIKPRFTVGLGSLHWVANYEKNRWFLVVRVKKPPGDQLNKLLQALNQAAQTLDQPCLYVAQESPAAPVAKNRRRSSPNERRGNKAKPVIFEEHMVEKSGSHSHEDMSAHFHISIGWTLQNPEEKSGEVEGDFGTQSSIGIDIPIETVKVKIGNGIVVLPLASKTAETNGIVGL
ncbi:MAG: hypothetical protein Q9205_006050 [Flavoplaca limonia]